MNLLNVKRTFIKVIEKLKTHDTKIGNTTMGTTATTLTGAIAEHEGDISNLNSKLITYVIPVSKKVTIPAPSGNTPSSVTIDFTSELGGHHMWSCEANLQNRQLPFINNAGVVKTWVDSVTNTDITIKNTDTAWTNYDGFFLLFVR